MYGHAKKEAWITRALFNEWINHFLVHIGRMYGISNENCHLHIMDMHNSHITLDVVHTIPKTGLDVITIRSHTFYATQPLDVSIFKVFKMAFMKYVGLWTLWSKENGAMKEYLVQWVVLALKKAMNLVNIWKAFSATLIVATLANSP